MGIITNKVDSITYQLEDKNGETPDFKAESRAWLHGFRTYMWIDRYDNIMSLEKDEIKFRKARERKSNQGLQLVKLKQQLTRPGEYYINYDQKIIEFIPPKNYQG